MRVLVAGLDFHCFPASGCRERCWTVTVGSLREMWVHLYPCNASLETISGGTRLPFPWAPPSDTCRLVIKRTTPHSQPRTVWRSARVLKNSYFGSSTQHVSHWRVARSFGRHVRASCFFVYMYTYTCIHQNINGSARIVLHSVQLISPIVLCCCVRMRIVFTFLFQASR